MYAWMLDHDGQIREEGWKEGWKEGKREQATDTAAEMLKEREPIAKIIQYSHLTEKEILNLAKKLGVSISSFC